MDAYRAIVTKRDTRKYDARPVPAGVLERVLQAGRMAGSSKNSQPVRVVVVDEAPRKVELAACGQFAEHVPGCAVALAVVLTPGGGAFDAGRAAQNMMVAAWAEGVTSCATSMHDAECARRVLALPEGHTVAIVLAMGYPEPAASLHGGRQRVSMEEFAHRDRWAGR
ncbi:MAG: nitroreductase family protein [Tepidiformaceae bacterium]